MATILPIPYFHAVFTMPHELGGLALVNRAAIFDLLFSAASRTLLDLGQDPKRLGAILGVTAVLHTWTRDLRWHVHLHCVVTGGGLSPAEDRWIHGHENYLFPVEVTGALFRGKFLDGLCELRDRGKLTFDGPCAELADPRAFARFKDALYRTDWVVYAKRPFAGPEQVFKYLGHYTHRIGLSNARLISFDERGVCFRTEGEKKVTGPTRNERRCALPKVQHGPLGQTRAKAPPVPRHALHVRDAPAGAHRGHRTRTETPRPLVARDHRRDLLRRPHAVRHGHDQQASLRLDADCGLGFRRISGRGPRSSSPYLPLHRPSPRDVR